MIRDSKVSSPPPPPKKTLGHLSGVDIVTTDQPQMESGHAVNCVGWELPKTLTISLSSDGPTDIGRRREDGLCI